LIPASEKPWGIDLDTYFMSHGHLHAGTFNLYWRGEAYNSELKVPDYPPDYWTPNRWDYPFANSLGHNTVLVDGERQISGKGIGGKIVEFNSSDTRDYTLMDASNAYPGNRLKRWRRHLVLDKPYTTVVLDEIDAVQGARIAVRFHSDCEIELHNQFLLLKGRDGLMALIPFAEIPFEFETGEHNLSNIADPFERTVHSPSGEVARYMDVSWLAGDMRNLLASVILPVESAEEARAVAASASLDQSGSGEVVISFQKAEKAFLFKFSPAEGGVTLK